MVINPIQIVQGIAGLVSALKVDPAKEANPTALATNTVKPIGDKYDVNNMSLDELKSLFQELYEAGKLSAADAMNLSSDKLLNQVALGPKDAKVDMLQLFQQQIEALKGVDSKSADLADKALNILKGVQASSGSDIPSFI